MKKTMIMIWLLVLVFAPVWTALAQDSNANVNTNQGQNQGQTLLFAPVSISEDNTSIGSMPNVYPTGKPQMLYIPIEPKHRQLNDLPGVTISGVLQTIDRQGLNVFRRTSDEFNGKGYVKKVESLVTRIPVFRRHGTEQVDQVFIVNELKAKDILIRPGIEVHGVMAYDTELNKKPELRVTRQQIYMFAGDDAMNKTRSNVLIPLTDSLRNQLKADSFGADLLGMITKLIATQNPLGYAMGGGANYVSGNQTIYGETGATIAFVYVEPNLLAQILASPLDELQKRMHQREQELAECTKTGANNARLHTEQADDYVRLFLLSKDEGVRTKALNEAKNHYERALKNGISESGEQSRIYGQLSKVYTELALNAKTAQARNDHASKAQLYGQKAGFLEAHRLIANNG